MGFRAGQIVISEADRATAEPCHDFWDTLRTTFSDKTMHLVLDNATIHHAQVLQPYFLDHLDVSTANLNNTERNTERLWKGLREKGILNTYFPNLDAIREAIARFLSYLATVPDEIQSRLGRLPA